MFIGSLVGRPDCSLSARDQEHGIKMPYRSKYYYYVGSLLSDSHRVVRFLLLPLVVANGVSEVSNLTKPRDSDFG